MKSQQSKRGVAKSTIICSIVRNRLFLLLIFIQFFAPWKICANAAPIRMNEDEKNNSIPSEWLDMIQSSDENEYGLPPTSVEEYEDLIAWTAMENIDLDQETFETTNPPMCAISDDNEIHDDSLYVYEGVKWMTKNLTYRISKYSRRLNFYSKDHIDEEIKRAFEAWESVTDFNFTQKFIGEADIDIRFERGDHGDGSPFDGELGSWLWNGEEFYYTMTHAHAFLPGTDWGGDVHFDDDDNWTINSDGGINLFWVAVHEIGHALGLDHSENVESIMTPEYRKRSSNFKLHSDDIVAIQALYGKMSTSSV